MINQHCIKLEFDIEFFNQLSMILLHDCIDIIDECLHVLTVLISSFKTVTATPGSTSET
jgi:hypothetical protein